MVVKKLKLNYHDMGYGVWFLGIRVGHIGKCRNS